jgi:hypothetical protein
MPSLAVLMWVFAQPVDYRPRVAVEAAYVCATRKKTEPLNKCCGQCVGGKVVHGDGHVTECPCPPACKCRTPAALLHDPLLLECRECSHAK